MQRKVNLCWNMSLALNGKPSILCEQSINIDSDSDLDFLLVTMQSLKVGGRWPAECKQHSLLTGSRTGWKRTTLCTEGPGLTNPNPVSIWYLQTPGIKMGPFDQVFQFCHFTLAWLHLTANQQPLLPLVGLILTAVLLLIPRILSFSQQHG